MMIKKRVSGLLAYHAKKKMKFQPQKMPGIGLTTVNSQTTYEKNEEKSKIKEASLSFFCKNKLLFPTHSYFYLPQNSFSKLYSYFIRDLSYSIATDSYYFPYSISFQ